MKQKSCRKQYDKKYVEKRNIYIALVQISNCFEKKLKKKKREEKNLFKLQEMKRKISHFFHLFMLYISEQVLQSASLFGLHLAAALVPYPEGGHLHTLT